MPETRVGRGSIHEALKHIFKVRSHAEKSNDINDANQQEILVD